MTAEPDWKCVASPTPESVAVRAARKPPRALAQHTRGAYGRNFLIPAIAEITHTGKQETCSLEICRVELGAIPEKKKIHTSGRLYRTSHLILIRLP